MKVYVIVLTTLLKLAASAVDEELHAKYMTMTRSNFIEHFNKRNYSWKIQQYTNISLNILSDFNIHDRTSEGLPVKHIDPKLVYEELPAIFDARKKWPQCWTIKEIRNQLHCNSCWAHGVANTASDRMCIHSGKMVDLSEQDLECSHPQQTICHSGQPAIGFQFWKDLGLVPNMCKPYEPYDVNRNECVRFCKYNPVLGDYLNAKVKAKEVYTVPNNSWQIKAELFLNGPIQALMDVYEDFRNDYGHSYSSGIYEHTHGEYVGSHSVRVIGYGVENDVEYWLAANSWGPQWGEEGFFRIKSFQPLIHFEDAMSTGIPL